MELSSSLLLANSSNQVLQFISKLLLSSLDRSFFFFFFHLWHQTMRGSILHLEEEAAPTRQIRFPNLFSQKDIFQVYPWNGKVSRQKRIFFSEGGGGWERFFKLPRHFVPKVKGLSWESNQYFFRFAEWFLVSGYPCPVGNSKCDALTKWPTHYPRSRRRIWSGECVCVREREREMRVRSGKSQFGLGRGGRERRRPI